MKRLILTSAAVILATTSVAAKTHQSKVRSFGTTTATATYQVIPDPGFLVNEETPVPKATTSTPAPTPEPTTLVEGEASPVQPEPTPAPAPTPTAEPTKPPVDPHYVDIRRGNEILHVATVTD